MISYRDNITQQYGVGEYPLDLLRVDLNDDIHIGGQLGNVGRENFGPRIDDRHATSVFASQLHGNVHFLSGKWHGETYPNHTGNGTRISDLGGTHFEMRHITQHESGSKRAP